jgi:hypothetical protein
VSQIGQILYVVVCYDRHSGDGISVHATREGADTAIAAFQATYDDSTWTERNYGRDQGWVRYVDTHDDGPRARIEETKLKP